MSGSKDGLDIDSERDLRRIEVLSDVQAGRRTVAAAAAVLAVSERRAYRLLARYEFDGGGRLIHKARGRALKPEPEQGIWKYVVELVKTRYADFRGPTLRGIAGQASSPSRPRDPAPMDVRSVERIPHDAGALPSSTPSSRFG